MVREVLEIKEQAAVVAQELIEVTRLQKGQLLVIGCSSSEIVGQRIGKGSSKQAAEAVWNGMYPVLQQAGISVCVQCCEHLNRALVIERRDAERFGFEIVNVIPQLHAGGAFAVTAYENFDDPVVVETVRADAGIDIGGVLIGMHLKRVAVPVRLSEKFLGEAMLLCARTRPKYIGGWRAAYHENM